MLITSLKIDTARRNSSELCEIVCESIVLILVYFGGIFCFNCFLKQDIKNLKMSNLYLCIQTGIVQLSTACILLQQLYCNIATECTSIYVAVNRLCK